MGLASTLFRRTSSTGHYDSTWIQYFADEKKNHSFTVLSELKDAVWDKIQPSYLESLTTSMSNRLCQVMRKFEGPSSY
uniref:Uncharacterized protein n=1 Tax=Caenorhabditis japonica TaxID=281687 RepID=A0A2Q4TIH2_CAEJA